MDCPHWFIRYQEVETASEFVAVVCDHCNKYLRAERRSDIPAGSPDAHLRRDHVEEAPAIDL